MITHNNNVELICGLLLILSMICVTFQHSLAQTTPECDIQSAPQDDTHTTPDSSELLPDVTSDICLIMTPDLPGNLATDDFQDHTDPELQTSNKTNQTIISDTITNNLKVIPENSSIVVPSDISPLISNETSTLTLQDNSENNTRVSLANQSQISNAISEINPISLSKPTNTSLNIPINETINSTAANETIFRLDSISSSNGSQNHVIGSNDLTDLTEGLEANQSKIKLMNFTSEGGYSLAFPQNWNLTVNGNETHIISDKLNSDYFPLLSIFIQKIDPTTINNTQALSQMLPIEKVPNETIYAILNNSKLQSNLLLKYYIDLEYDVLEPTQTEKYNIDGKQASSFKVHKSDDNYEKEFIVVHNNGKIYSIEINYDYFLLYNDDGIEVEQLKQQLIDSIKWINDTKLNVDLQEIIDQKIVNNSETDSNEIKSKISSSEADLNITSSTYFFDEDNFKIVGEVLNNGSDKRELVKVVITLYDGNNNVIGTELSYTNPTDIFSKQTAPFEIIISQGDVRNTSAIKSYKLYLTSDVEKPSNASKQSSIGNPAISSDIISSDVQSLRSSPNATTSPNALDMLMNLFKDANSTVSSGDSLSNFTMNVQPTNSNSNPLKSSNNVVESIIVPGASILADTAYDPNPIEINTGQTVLWTNDDTAFHTVTSGTPGAPNAGELFDSGLAGPTAMTSKGKTFKHTFDKPGEYQYFCTLHPYMVGKIIVS